MIGKIREKIKVVFNFPDYKNIQELFDYLSKMSIKIFYTTVSVLAIYIFIGSLFSSDYTMNPISIPSDLSKDGYSEEIFSREIMDRFNEISRETDEFKNEGKEKEVESDEVETIKANKSDDSKDDLISDINAINFSNGLENLDVEVLGLGLSIGKLSEYIRVLLGVEVKKISGELVRKDDKLLLNMRLTGFPPLNYTAENGTTDHEQIKDLKEQAALGLKKYFSPLELTFYLYKKKNYEKAIIAAEYVIDQKMENMHWAYYIIAQCEIESNKNYKSAFKNFERAIMEYDDFVEAWYNWGYYLYKKRSFENAIKKFEKVISIKSTHNNAYVYWGTCLFELDDFEEAILKHQTAIDLMPENDHAHYSLGFDYKYLAQYEKAISYYKKAIDLNDKKINYYMDLADCYFYNGDTARAMKTYVDAKNKVRFYDKQQELYKAWSAASLLSGREQEAISIMSQHLLWEDKLDDYTTQEILYDVYIELSISEFYDEKIKFYKKGITENKYKSYYFTNLAFIYSSIGEYDSAIYYYNDFYKRYTSNTSYYDEMANIYMAKEDYLNAKIHFEKHQEIEPNDAKDFANWGLTLLRNKEIDEAFEKFQKARSFGVGTYLDVYHGLALVSKSKGNSNVALSYYYQALDKKVDPLVAFEYATLLKEVDRVDESDSVFMSIFEIEGFDSRYRVEDIYMQRGIDVLRKYYSKLISLARKKGRFYTLLAYGYALDGNDDEFIKNMKKAVDEGFPIKAQMRYFPFNKKAYAVALNKMINE